MIFKPLKDRVLVKRGDVKTETSGGLYIPEGAREKELHGEVLSVGDGVKDVAVGDKVLFGKNDGVNIHEDYAGAPNCILIQESQIRAIYA